MSRWKVIVIGGGASGLMAANYVRRHAKQGGMAPCVLEGNGKMGKKLLATGNGRCNLTNLDISPEHYHGDPLAAQVLERYPAQRVLAAFEKMGFLFRVDGEGRVYPRGDQAASVLETLVRGAGSWEPGAPVASIRKTGERPGGFFVVETADGRRMEAEKVILACGGVASPSHSMGGQGYELVQSFGHTVTELTPSLAPLRTSSAGCASLKGMRAKARATLYRDGKAVYGESGEMIFGDRQLSGICIFNLSARLRELGPGAVEVGLDLLEGMELPEVTAYLKRLREYQPLWYGREMLSGALNQRVGQALAKAAGIPGDQRVKRIGDEGLERLARLAKDWRFPITGPGGWKDAQVTAGGVPLSEVDLDTMESKLCPGLYLTGELLDVDGDCGGYNLHWAWATGMIAGKAAAKTEGK